MPVLSLWGALRVRVSGVLREVRECVRGVSKSDGTFYYKTGLDLSSFIFYNRFFRWRKMRGDIGEICGKRWNLK